MPKEIKTKPSAFESPVLADLSKDLGLTRYSDTDYGRVKDRLPTFIPSIDYALGGGIPFSKLTEAYGEPQVGKSTVSMALIRAALILGAVPIVFDVEGTDTNERLEEVNIDPRRVLLKRPEVGSPLTVEEIVETMIPILEQMGKEYPNAPVFFVWDSVAQTQSAMEDSAAIGEARVGALAHALAVTFRKLMPALNENNGCLFCINQARDDIGGNPFLSTVATVGGKAFKHNASYRLFLSKGQKVKANASDKEGIGHGVNITLTKAKGKNEGRREVGYVTYEDGLGYEFNIYNLFKEKKLFGGSAQYPSFVDSSGEEHKMRGNDWTSFLKSPEGALCRREMWQMLIKLYFPEGYPPLYNETLPLTPENFPDCEGLKEYYDSLNGGI